MLAIFAGILQVSKTKMNKNEQKNNKKGMFSDDFKHIYKKKISVENLVFY